MGRSTPKQPTRTDDHTAAGAGVLDVLSHVVHELRSPLTVITGYAALLGGPDPSPAEVAEFADAIARNARTIQRRLECLSDTEEVLRGSLALSLEACDLGALVDDALARHVEDQGPHPTRVHTESSVVVSADRRRLAQAIGHLVDNAVRVSPADEVVDVAVTATADAACVRVSDRGSVVPEELRPQATGVGLFLARAIVEAHGGTLRLAPAAGGGSAFTIEVPVARGAADDLRREQPARTVDPTTSHRRPGRATVLHVEDDRATAELVERVLTAELDVAVVLATHAGHVPDLVDRHRPSVVLLDLRVGDHDGEAVLRQLRSDPVTAGLPVAIVSGGLTELRASELVRTGADAVLAKPFHPDQLCETVRALLAGSPTGTGSTSPSAGPVQDEPLDDRFVEALVALGNDSDDGISDLVHSMVSDAQAQMRSLQLAAENGDTAEAGRRAHSLSGGIGNLGAHVVVRRCGELETAARAGDAAAVSWQVGLVSAALVDASTALGRRFPNPPSTTGRNGDR